MSIASEITRLSSAKAALKDAIVAKGVEVADDVKLDGYAEKIAAIPTGSKYKWNPPSDWPDLRKIVDDDDPVSDGLTQTTYQYKVGILLDVKDEKNLSFTNGGSACRFQDGTFISTGGNINHTIPEGYEDYYWVIVYSNNNHFGLDIGRLATCLWIYQFQDTVVNFPEFQLATLRCIDGEEFYCKTRCPYLSSIEHMPVMSVSTSYSLLRWFSIYECKIKARGTNDIFKQIAYGDKALKKISIELFNSPKVSCENSFKECYCLDTIEIKTVDGTDTIDVSDGFYAFYNTGNLRNIPKLKTSSYIDATAMFYGTGLFEIPFDGVFKIKVNNATFYDNKNLRRLPNNIDCSECRTKYTSIFNSNPNLEQFPEYLTMNFSFSFKESSAITDFDSFAKFENDEIVGGLIYNINACPNNGETMTFASMVRDHYSTEELAKIYAMAEEKNWGIVWA